MKKYQEIGNRSIFIDDSDIVQFVRQNRGLSIINSVNALRIDEIADGEILFDNETQTELIKLNNKLYRRIVEDNTIKLKEL